MSAGGTRLTRAELLRGWRNDGTRIDPGTEVSCTDPDSGEVRTFTAQQVAAAFGVSPTAVAVRQLLPPSEAEYYAQTTAKHFLGGDPAARAGSVFLVDPSIQAVMSHLTSDQLSPGHDDRDRIAALMRQRGATDAEIAATFMPPESGVRYLLAHTAGVQGVLPVSRLGRDALVELRIVKGVPCPVLVENGKDEVPGYAPVSCATVIVGPVEEGEGELVWTLHPGLPTPSDRDVTGRLAELREEQLTRPSDEELATLDEQQLAELRQQRITELRERDEAGVGGPAPVVALADVVDLGVGFVQLPGDSTELPGPPDGITLAERAAEAYRYAELLDAVTYDAVATSYDTFQGVLSPLRELDRRLLRADGSFERLLHPGGDVGRDDWVRPHRGDGSELAEAVAALAAFPQEELAGGVVPHHRLDGMVEKVSIPEQLERVEQLLKGRAVDAARNALGQLERSIVESQNEISWRRDRGLPAAQPREPGQPPVLGTSELHATHRTAVHRTATVPSTADLGHLSGRELVAAVLLADPADVVEQGDTFFVDGLPFGVVDPSEDSWLYGELPPWSLTFDGEYVNSLADLGELLRSTQRVGRAPA